MTWMPVEQLVSFDRDFKAGWLASSSCFSSPSSGRRCAAVGSEECSSRFRKYRFVAADRSNREHEFGAEPPLGSRDQKHGKAGTQPQR